MALGMNLIKAKEHRLQVRHVLASYGSVGKVRLVCPGRQALDRCGELCNSRGWVTTDAAPDGKPITDTSAAAELVAQMGVAYAAATCSVEAAGCHGLPVVMDRGR